VTPHLDWIEEFPSAITVSDREGIIVAMNRVAREVFAADGGAALLGTSVFDCHPEPSRSLLQDMFRLRREHHYTIRTRTGLHKMIHQVPWFRDGEFAGFVEISLAVPDRLPHFDRSPAATT
jgi:transcriptional regulator with PAS, ATPase and Fis domain